MGRFGEKLKAAREERGITLATISSKTRVSVRLLGALESERFDLLPGGVFNVSFLRQYCRAVGIDEEEMVAEFNELARPPELEVTEKAEAQDNRVLMEQRGATFAENVTDYLRHYGKVTAAGVVALLVVVVLTWVYPGGSGADAEPAQTTAPVAQPPASMEDAAAAEEATAGVSEPTPAAPDTAAEQTPPLLAGASAGLGSDAVAANNAATASASDLAKPLHVEISITAKVWVQAVADGVRIFEDILEPGATRSIQASDSVRLVVGNAAGVTVALNGKVLPPIGPSGQVRRVVLTSTGMEIDRIEPNRPPGETASDASFETRNPSHGSVPALAIAKPER